MKTKQSIHARCFSVGEKSGHRLICLKSKGHTDSKIEERREHFDPDADERWPS